ncbi:MAG: ComEC/Rec2 family competence protein [Anaerolineales bacterium]
MQLLWISISFLAGIVLANNFFLPTWVWTLIAVLFLFVFILLRFFSSRSGSGYSPSSNNQQFSLSTFYFLFATRPIYFALPIFLFLGSAYYQVRQPNIDAFHIAFYNDRNYELLITGSLSEPPDYRDNYTNLKLKVEAVDTGSGDMPVSGEILVRVAENEEYEYGERIRVRGQLQTPPENEEFSYRDYLARSGVYSYMKTAEVTRLPGSGGNLIFIPVFKLKATLLEHTYRIFQDPEASLLAGILFGVDTGLSRKLQDAFKNTGTAHIIAISGFNIAIIAGVFHSIFKNIFGAKWGALVAIVAVFLYSFLVGGDAAVLRAAIMGSMSMVAVLLGRKQWMIGSLFFVAAVMALINPLVLWDIGFQLSFFATLGLILYAEPFSNYTANLISRFSKQDNSAIVKILNENVILTLAAQVMTIPLMAYYFNRISLISFVANPFILPVQPAVMILGGVAVFASLIFLPLGQFLAWIAWPFAGYTIRVVEFFNRVPHGVLILGDVPLWFIYSTYITLLAVTLNWSTIQAWFKSAASSLRAVALTAAFSLVFICMMLVWTAASQAGDGRFHITFLEVGSADAMLIQTPEGRNILINGGASTAELSDELGRRLPFFSRKLDWLIIASTDEEQLSALPRIVERYVPENVLWSGNAQASFSAQLLDKYFAEQGIPVSRAETGQRLELGGGAFIEVQAAGPRGSVLLIQDGNFRTLLPIGLDEGTLESLEFGNSIGKVDVLLLADSGYAPSNPPDMFENLNPQLVVLSVAAGDPDGLPSQDVLESLDGYSLLRTDRSGWIDVSTDGTEMRVTVERGE